MSSPMTEFVRPSAEEVVLGALGPSQEPTPAVAEGGSPREALEAEVASRLRDGPVFVSFSGGRDSSAVLAVAVHVARREGLELPRPVILRYPDDAAADETEWQELVLGHLGIEDPIVLEIADRTTYLGSSVQANLRSRGLILPPSLQLDQPVLGPAAGHTLLTGEGGDEILGTRRITPFTLLLRLRRRPRRSLLRWAMSEAAPARARARRMARVRLTNAPWFTPEAVRRLRHLLLIAERHRPMHWGRETLSIASSHVVELVAHNYQAIADQLGVRIVHPLLAPSFVAALAAAGGRWGYAGRTALMRELFADLLPDALLARSTKASFGSVRWGEPEREFARAWDGAGALNDLVDAEVIRAEWLSEHPRGTSVGPLHAAWLHAQGLTWDGAEDD